MSLAIDHPSGGAFSTPGRDELRRGAPVVLRGRPLVGHLPELRADPLSFFTRIARDHGDVVELHFGFDKVLMLNNPAMIRHVLQDNRLNYEKSKFYDVMRAVLGNGIFLAEGDEWLSQRRTAARSFQGCQLRRMTAAMQDAVGDLQQRWSGLAARGAVIDLIPEMMRLTLDILMRTLFSLRLDDDQYAEIFRALTVVLRDAERRIWSPFNPPRWLPTSRNREVKAALRVLDAFVFDLIDKRCAERAKAQTQADGEAREGEGDLLDLLLDNRNGRTDRQICDQFQSMILAGHETTANGLSWCWYLLSLHPESLRRLRAEVREVLQGRPAGFADLPQLTYTRMVFDETLRLYPPLWTFSRVAVADDEFAGLKLPAGTNVMLNMFAVHRRPELWDNPEGFDPARFDPQLKNSQRFAYFPFSDGPRSCLGERFAILESMIALAGIVDRFDLQLLPGQKVEPEPMITLRPRGPLLMRITPAPAA